MTKEQLLKALSVAVMDEDVLSCLYDESRFDDKSDEEVAAVVSGELYSDALLEHLNKNMKPMFAVRSVVDGYNVTDMIHAYELNIGHGIRVVPRLYDKKAVMVGWFDESFGGDGFLSYKSGIAVFLDEDGEFFTLSVYSYHLDFSDVDDDEEDNDVTIYERCDEKSFLLNGIESFFPESYHGLWDL